MSEDLTRAIIASATGGIIAGVVLKILTETKWIRSLKRVFQWVVSAFYLIAAILTIYSIAANIIRPIEWEVEGRVINKHGKAPIKNARVTIEKFSAQTGNEGRFLIRYNETPISITEIRVEKDRYALWKDFVPINNFTTIELEPQIQDSALPEEIYQDE